MSTLNKSLISLAIVFATSSVSYAATNTPTSDKIVRADFANKLLLIPCVEVTNTSFDGFWNVVMEVSGNGSGLDWKVKEATKAVADECDAAPSTSSTDELLKSMGMPSTGELIKNSSKGDTTSKPTPTPAPSSTQTGISDSINNTINSAINGAIPKN